MLDLAAAFTVAMAATRPEGVHGDDAHPAKLLTIQESGMTSGLNVIAGLSRVLPRFPLLQRMC